MVVREIVPYRAVAQNDPHASVDEFWQWAKAHDPSLYAEHLVEETQQRQWQEKQRRYDASPKGKAAKIRFNAWETETREEHERELDTLLAQLKKPPVNHVERAMLGIDANASPAKKDVRNAYRRMARKMHPDKGGSDEAFKALYTAYRKVLATAHN